eukprot:scaffold6860_cov162-Amphora_coffeaeformis.AAC.2
MAVRRLASKSVALDAGVSPDVAVAPSLTPTSSSSSSPISITSPPLVLLLLLFPSPADDDSADCLKKDAKLVGARPKAMADMAPPGSGCKKRAMPVGAAAALRGGRGAAFQVADADLAG